MEMQEGAGAKRSLSESASTDLRSANAGKVFCGVYTCEKKDEPLTSRTAFAHLSGHYKKGELMLATVKEAYPILGKVGKAKAGQWFGSGGLDATGWTDEYSDTSSCMHAPEKDVAFSDGVPLGSRSGLEGSTARRKARLGATPASRRWRRRSRRS